jgi:hypothetical protein
MRRFQSFFAGKVAEPIRRNLSWHMRRFYPNADPSPAKSVFVCGAGRSGTTWLVEALNANNEYRMMYEPFNCNQVRACSRFYERQYLRPNDGNPDYLDPAAAIFSGNMRDPWIDQYNHCRNPRGRLIKDVRSTLMLKWIRTHFPEMPIVFIMRHPCAVALSRLDLGWRTDLREKVFFAQSTLVEDFLETFADAITWAEAPFERYVVDWSIENLIPLAQLGAEDAYVVFYENLVLNPVEEFQKIFSFLKRPFEESMLLTLHRRSASSRLKRGNLGAIRMHGNNIESWKKYVSAAQVAAAMKVIEIFGLDRVYGIDAQPRCTDAQSLFAVRDRSFKSFSP